MRKWRVDRAFTFTEIQEMIFPTQQQGEWMGLSVGDIIYESQNTRQIMIKGRWWSGRFDPSWKSYCTERPCDLVENEVGDTGTGGGAARPLQPRGGNPSRRSEVPCGPVTATGFGGTHVR